MNTLPTTSNLYYILIFVFLASFTTLSLILLYSFYTWIVSRKKNVIYKELYEVDPRSDAYKQALKIIEDARAKSIELLKDAHLEKQTILESSDKVEKEIKELFENKARQLGNMQQKSLESMSNEFIEKYEDTLEIEKYQTTKSISDISSIIRKDLLNEVKEFSNALKSSTYESQKLVEQKIQNEYELAKKEIQAYKDTTITRLDTLSREIIRQVTHEIVGKSMTVEDHEELIKKSLEKIIQSSEFSTI